MKVSVIIVAGGSGTRLKSKKPKALVPLKTLPLVSYSLKAFNSHRLINDIVLVGVKENLAEFGKLAHSFKKVHAVISGGKLRSDSVKCGLAVINPDVDIVLVHDAARPFVDAGIIDRLLMSLRNNKAAIAATPFKSTVKKVNRKTLVIEDTPERDLLWEAQTPQGFHKDVLVKAHAKLGTSLIYTDDAMMVEALGIKVKVVMGDYRNIKITTPEDLKIAQVIMS